MAPGRVKRNFGDFRAFAAAFTKLHDAPVQSSAADDSSPRFPASLSASPLQVPGTAPQVVEGGPEGVLLLHGYTGSPWEVAPLLPVLKDRGYTCAMPVLAGHGTTVDELERTTWRDWLASGSEAGSWLRRRCQTVHLVALSMGCLVALKLLQRDGPHVWRSAVLLAPALTLGGPTERAIAAMAALGWPRRLGKEPPPLARGMLPPAYWQIPVTTTMSLLEMMQEVRTSAHPRVPTLVLHGDLDRTIPMRRTRQLVRELLPQAQHRVIRGAGHLLPRTWQANKVKRQVVEFLVRSSAR